MKEEYGTTIFCEDIRDEIDGKRTFVGVYGSELVINGTLPAVIPQFAFAVTLLEPIERASGPLNVKIFMPGENGEEIALDIDLPIERHIQETMRVPDPSAEFVGAMMSFKVSPLVIVSEGHIRVRAYKDHKEIRLGSLRVRILNPTQMETVQ